MTQKIRWGILSTAGIGEKRVIPAIHKSKNGEVVAVASRSLERAQAFATDNDIPLALGSYEALLQADIDAVYIPVPNDQHAEWSIRAAEAGIPTLCEKPLALDAKQAQTIVDAFKKHKVTFAEAFMYRFHPQTVRVKQMIDEGAIGDIKVINATFDFSVRNENDIRLQQALGGGALMDVGCYCINIMRHLTGEEPVSGSATANFGQRTDVDETIVATLVFPSGVLGHLDASLRAHRTHQYDVRGTDGRIVVEEGFVPDQSAVTVIRHWQGAHYDEIHINAVDQYQLMVEDFADAVLKKRPPRFDGQDAVNNMRVIDMLLASARSHQI